MMGSFIDLDYIIEACQLSRMELFAKIVNGSQPLSIFVKSLKKFQKIFQKVSMFNGVLKAPVYVEESSPAQ